MLRNLRFRVDEIIWDITHFCRQAGVIVTAFLSTFIIWGAFRPDFANLDSLEVFELALLWLGAAAGIFVFGWAMYGEGWPSISYVVPKEPKLSVDEYPTPEDVDRFVKSLPVKK